MLIDLCLKFKRDHEYGRYIRIRFCAHGQTLDQHVLNFNDISCFNGRSYQ